MKSLATLFIVLTYMMIIIFQTDTAIDILVVIVGLPFWYRSVRFEASHRNN